MDDNITDTIWLECVLFHVLSTTCDLSVAVHMADQRRTIVYSVEIFYSSTCEADIHIVLSRQSMINPLERLHG